MEAILLNLKSTGVFILVLSILIIVHEWGHFITAKKLGVKVERFSLGFGPKLFSKILDGTEFAICLIPLGGYVKMAGDIRSESQGKPYEFYSKTPGQRALIVINGPLINYALAYFCFVIVFILGYPDLAAKVGKLLPDYPAYQSGIQEGDRIAQINDKGVEHWTQMQTEIASSTTDQIKVKVIRGDQEYIYYLEPKIEKMRNIFGQYKETRLLGIRPTEEIVLLKYGFGVSFVKAFQKITEITVLTFKSVYFMVTGSMSAKESMTGPIGIFYIIKAAAEIGFSYLLFIIGAISASLAIFNLFPIIPLDGGHLILFGIERLRGKALSEKFDEYIAKFGFSLIILLAIFVFYTDFERFGWIARIKQIFF